MPRRKSARRLEDLCVDRIASCLNSVNSTLNSLPSLFNKGNPFLCLPSFLLKEIYYKLYSLTNIIHVEILKILFNSRMKAIDMTFLEISDADFEEVLKSIIEIAPILSRLILPLCLDNEFSRQLMFDLGAKLSRITYLDLGFVYMEDFLDVIGKNCKLLVSLKMYSDLVCDKDLECLCFNTKEPTDDEPRCQNLQNILLGPNVGLIPNLITMEGIKSLINHLPKLSYVGWFDVAKVLLDLHKNDYFSTETVYSLKNIFYSHTDRDNILWDIVIKTCPFLTTLNLKNLDDSNLVKIQTLQHLNIWYTLSESEDGISVEPYSFDGGILPLLKGIGKSLESLYLMVKEINFAVIGQCCPQLITFHCRTTCIVSSSNDMFGISTFSKLEHATITFYHRTDLSLNNFLTLFGNCLHLKDLLLSGVENFNLSILKEIMKTNPLSKLESLNLCVNAFDHDLLEFIISDENLFSLLSANVKYLSIEEESKNFLFRLVHTMRCKNLDLEFSINYRKFYFEKPTIITRRYIR